MLQPEVQLVPLTKNVIMAALTPKSVVQLTAFIAFEAGRKLNPACCNYVDFSNQPLISVAQKRSFPKSNNSHTCTDLYFLWASTKMMKNLLIFFNKNIARERIDKRFKEFCYFRLLKIVII